jgi:hypothetical protein
MALFTVQANGRITVAYRMENDEILSFSITSDNGEAFIPHTTVEIADIRIDAIAAQLALPFGVGIVQRIESNGYESTT